MSQHVKKCELLNDSMVTHVLCFCTKNYERRKHLWDEIILTKGIDTFLSLTAAIECQC